MQVNLVDAKFVYAEFTETNENTAPEKRVHSLAAKYFDVDIFSPLDIYNYEHKKTIID